MGLTNRSVGRRVADTAFSIHKQSQTDTVIALAGNPNVGKSTVFNGLTGMHQHTGNWPGKTVANVQGVCKTPQHRHILVDIPGTYSLMAHSAEECIARDFICFGNPDAVVLVCDATCLERNLNLVLQTMEIASRVVVCVNLLDEAARHHITVDIPKLSKLLGVPVVGITAREHDDLHRLIQAVDTVLETTPKPFRIPYPPAIEDAIKPLVTSLRPHCDKPHARWLALKLLENSPELSEQIAAAYGTDLLTDPTVLNAITDAETLLEENNITKDRFLDLVASASVKQAEHIAKQVVTYPTTKRHEGRLDRFLTGRITGYLMMILLAAFILWLTIVGANYPSELLSKGLFWVQNQLTELFSALNAPSWLHGALVLGVYRVLAWVISVMLPPMAIFFPLFTLLEDVGYLPRIAYNLDKPFARCNACGKQALTMCMGFGCNAAGVVGCRIIDSPRERLLAVLTNSFVPCNGRFPTLITLIGIFFITTGGVVATLSSALLLTAMILLGVFATFAATKLLSCTVLKGVPSAFTLELPPFRKPQIGKVIWRSIWERTIFVLGRAAAVAAPAGLFIWLTANIYISGNSLLQIGADCLEPLGRLMGMDGVILVAFILGFPANEIVLPIILMAYMASGTLTDIHDLSALRDILVLNGWTPLTAVSMMIFSLFHWPCSTTLLTVHKETGSLKWTALAALFPTTLGTTLCMLFTAIYNLVR